MGYQRRVRFNGSKSMLHRVEFGGEWDIHLRRRQQAKKEVEPEPQEAEPDALALKDIFDTGEITD